MEYNKTMREPLGETKERIAVDIDDTVTNGNAAWWNGESPDPNEQAIEWVNSQYFAGHTIFMWTARPESARPQTEAWLAEHGVRYHALVMNKLSASMYIDDKAVPAEMIQQDDAPDVGELNLELSDQLGHGHDANSEPIERGIPVIDPEDVVGENTDGRGGEVQFAVGDGGRNTLKSKLSEE